MRLGIEKPERDPSEHAWERGSAGERSEATARSDSNGFLTPDFLIVALIGRPFFWYNACMGPTTLAGGVAHSMPADLRRAFSPRAAQTWQSLTPLSRNEWICWVVSVKRAETRQEHVRRAVQDLAAGKRRPCCWMGCTHRTDKPLSASQKFVLKRQAKKGSNG